MPREEKDLVFGNIKRYFDHYRYEFIGVRFKDSYLKRYFESDLVALEDPDVIENDGIGFVRIDFGCFYMVFTDESDKIIIIEMLYEDQYKKVMLVSDLDLKEVMGYK